jgi:3-phenylpropionate/trans-cinnamate dioxygenase ferredoxin reductase subunit
LRLVGGASIVIVGGGLSSPRFVKAYREAGGDASLTLVSADSSVPYHRPPLSKKYLRGETDADGTLVEKRDFYSEHEVELRLETLVTRARLDERKLELAEGGDVEFDRLVILSGARPKALGIAGEELEGVFKLRTLADSTAIRDRARDAKRAVVVGAGFIGMEVAASLTALGIDVTLVHRGEGLFEVFEAPPLSEYLLELYRERGVDVRLEAEVGELRGNGEIEAAVTAGGEELEADLVVLGLGVEPWVDWLEGSGLELDNGVVVNERFETNVDGVSAAGDVANFYDPVFGRRRRIEHWSNANYQGAELGRVLAGDGKGYDIVSTFFTEVFGVSLKLFGDTTGHDELVLRGDFARGKAIVFYLQEGRVVATLLTGQEEETENELKDILRYRPPVVDRDALADPDTPIAAPLGEVT